MRTPARLLLAAITLGGLLAPVSAAAAPPVVGGGRASQDYSFMAYLPGCTGTLIKDNWVVTAGHCPTPGTVRVGSIDRTQGGTVVGVRRAVSHPRIDVKLLELAAPAPYAPAPVPAESGAAGTVTRIIGWGQTCAAPGCGPVPRIANELDTTILADTRCSGIDGPHEICTSNPGNVAGACYGDSGGPQVRLIDDRWALIGVTSRAGTNSPVCGTGPSVYGDLPSIRPWLNTQVGGLPALAG
ncbi:S1 family peptidase [Actinoplanes philippinensis]|uniref:S1 family peptidase n=1 Tax=Actinoplanes philippinensis TaxID=35752 RepID=UPI0033D2EB42